MEILNLLPTHLHWEIQKFMIHPTADLMKSLINLQESIEDECIYCDDYHLHYTICKKSGFTEKNYNLMKNSMYNKKDQYSIDYFNDNINTKYYESFDLYPTKIWGLHRMVTKEKLKSLWDFLN